MMTVRDLLEVIEFDDREIFIKPNGRKMYFTGTVGEVPECLKQCVIRSLNPQIYANYTQDDAKGSMPSDNRLFRWALGVWVDSMPEMDEILQHQPEFGKDFSGKTFDDLYEKFFEIPLEERRAEQAKNLYTDEEIAVLIGDPAEMK